MQMFIGFAQPILGYKHARQVEMRIGVAGRHVDDPSQRSFSVVDLAESGLQKTEIIQNGRIIRQQFRGLAGVRQRFVKTSAPGKQNTQVVVRPGQPRIALNDGLVLLDRLIPAAD